MAVATESETPTISHDCTYVTEPTLCASCGFEINPVHVRVRTGYGRTRIHVRTGRAYKIGGRGAPIELICGSCFAEPRSALIPLEG